MENQDWVQEFSTFYKKQNLDHDIFEALDKLPRYVRIVGFNCRFSTSELGENEFPGLYSGVNGVINNSETNNIEATASRSELLMLEEYASQLQSELNTAVTPRIDLSSAIAVSSLEIGSNNHILDLCCAPGGKLLMISDIFARFGPPSEHTCGSISGVDISPHRLSTCKSQIKKSKSLGKIRIRLFLEDGTEFSTLPPADSWWDHSIRKNTPTSSSLETPKTPWFASKMLRTSTLSLSRHKDSKRAHFPSPKLYDKVLVDAECTHDGSLVHLAKYTSQDPFSKLDSEFLSDERVKNVSVLQYSLLVNGWELLEVGGVLIYSTCSLTPIQNEDVIAKFLYRSYMPFLEYINLINLGSESAIIRSDVLNNTLQSSLAGTSSLPNNACFLIPVIQYPSTSVLRTRLNISSVITDHLCSKSPKIPNRIISDLQKCFRLDPRFSDTSGMFIAKIRKEKMTIDEIVSFLSSV
ncbi:hypothetical protein BB560_002846 [Smittium megazygosporum]|uniref:SAM-dependent MTase RsmB/NOP-type domain-containing protein n=1 Tax=Smittium megazygosporum TaxID=133381 RepID=A0A2T9ZDK9_9FUNG|nr:hypothetical protein BB560_002846 [Smittium megazygosporum]